MSNNQLQKPTMIDPQLKLLPPLIMSRDSSLSDKVDPEERSSRFITSLLESDQSKDERLQAEGGPRRVLPRTTSWGEWDVPLGRSQEVRDHVGNKRYRQLVEKHRPAYLSATRRADKTYLTTSIFATINANGGRFLNKEVLESGYENWFEISEEKALAKISQALRMGTGKQGSGRSSSPDDSRSVSSGSTPPRTDRQTIQPWAGNFNSGTPATAPQVAGSMVSVVPFGLGAPLMTPARPQMQPWASHVAAAAAGDKTLLTPGGAPSLGASDSDNQVKRRDTEPRKFGAFPPQNRQDLPRRHSLPTLYSPVAQAPTTKPPGPDDVDLAGLSLEYWDADAEQVLSEPTIAASAAVQGQPMSTGNTSHTIGAAPVALPSATLQPRSLLRQQQHEEHGAVLQQPQEVARTLTDEVGDDDDFSVDELFFAGEIFDLEPIPVFSDQANNDQQGNDNNNNDEPTTDDRR